MGDQGKNQKMTMIRGIFFLLLLLSGCTPIPGKVLIGKEAPLLRLYRLDDGTETTLQTYAGHKIVLVFWSEHCGGSKRTLSAIEAFARQPKNRGNATYIAANLDGSDKLSEVKEEIAERKLYSFEHMMSGNEENDQAFIRSLGDRVPYILVVDEDGVVRDVDSDRDIVIDAKR